MLFFFSYNLSILPIFGITNNQYTLRRNHVSLISRAITLEHNLKMFDLSEHVLNLDSVMKLHILHNFQGNQIQLVTG